MGEEIRRLQLCPTQPGSNESFILNSNLGDDPLSVGHERFILNTGSNLGDEPDSVGHESFILNSNLGDEPYSVEHESFILNRT